MPLHLTIPDNPSETHREAVITPLRAYNLKQVADPRNRPVAILLTDDDGRHVGGLWGKIIYNWLMVELLAVPEEHRGENHGSRLMAKAEEIARTEDCAGIWLDTFEFQARGFYEKLGFEVFGTLEDHPAGYSRFFLRKTFQAFDP